MTDYQTLKNYRGDQTEIVLTQRQFSKLLHDMQNSNNDTDIVHAKRLTRRFKQGLREMGVWGLTLIIV